MADPIQSRPDVIDNNPGTMGRQVKSVTSPEPGTSAGHHRDAAS